MNKDYFIISTSKLPNSSLILGFNEGVAELFYSTKLVKMKELNTWVVKNNFSEKTVEVTVSNIEQLKPKVLINGHQVTLEVSNFNPEDLNEDDQFSIKDICLLIIRCAFAILLTLTFYVLGIIGIIGCFIAISLTIITNKSNSPKWFKLLMNSVWWFSMIIYWYNFEYIGGFTEYDY